jgi:hypothetical protein
MTEEIENNGTEKETPQNDSIDPFCELEEERQAPTIKEENDGDEEDEKPKKPIAKKERQKDNKAYSDSGNEDEEASGKNKDSDDVEGNNEIENLKESIEKTKKSLLESQKWGTKNSQKVKYALKTINALIENSAFTDEEHNTVMGLRDLLQADSEVELTEEKPENSHPVSKYLDIAKQKLEVMREVSDEPDEFFKKYRAFEWSVMDLKPDELTLLVDELEDLKDTPVKLAKRIMEIGTENHNNYYKEFHEAGSFRKIIENKNKEIKKLKDAIDKSKKKLLQYEDYDSNPRYRFKEDYSDIGDDSANNNTSGDPFEELEVEKARSHSKGNRRY